MTKLAELKTRLMQNPDFRDEYAKAKEEFVVIEETLRRYAEATGKRLKVEIV